MIPPEMTEKRYQCDRCKHVRMRSTNHYGPIYSWDRYNTCPKCPPHAKYMEFGGQTSWTCLDKPRPEEEDEE